MEADKNAKHTGSCHCQAVRFEVTIDAGNGSRCNCSVCTKINPVAAVAKPEAFKLLTSEAELSAYVWGGKISTRYFCKSCGVHCFARGHLAELGGDYVSINLNTLDDIDPIKVKLIHWDGRHNNWQAGPRDTPWAI
jgi:hypothetical protein